MLQTHAYDGWLSPAGKSTLFYKLSRLAGGYPAPLFLFLAGLSLAVGEVSGVATRATSCTVEGEPLY